MTTYGLRRFISRLDPTTRGWATVIMGDVVRLALGFVASVLIARALNPATFGIYAILGAVAGIAGTIADGGLSGAAVRRIAAVWQQQPAIGQMRSRHFFWIRLAAVLVIILPALLLVKPLHLILELPDQVDGVPATLLLALALLGVLASTFSGGISTILQATGHFGRIAIILIFNTGLTALLALALSLSGQLNLLSALAILGIGVSLLTFLIARQLLPETWSLKFATLSDLRLEMSHLLQFGRWLWLANILAVLTLQFDILLLNRLEAAEAVGLYALALSLATKADIVNRSLYTVLLPAAAGLKGRPAYIRYLGRGLVRSGVISLLLLPAIPLAEPFIRFFYGATYAPAAPLFRLLLVAIILDIFAMPLLLLAFPLNRPKWLAAIDGGRLATLVLVALWLVPTLGPVGAAGAKLLSRAAGVVLILFFLLRRGTKSSQ